MLMNLFVNVNKKVSYPSWQMSSVVGMVHASVLFELKKQDSFDSNLDYYLSSVAKLCMLFDYVLFEPKP
jgi:hypothetical protein